MAQIPNTKTTITKLDAARRQLDTAIDLWFREADDISIGTLAGAAHQIIHDLCRKRGDVQSPMFDSPVIREEYRKQWIRHWTHGILGFLKHADQQPDSVLEYNSVDSVGLLMAAIAGLARLTKQENEKAWIFTAWVAVHYPRWIKGDFPNILANMIPVEDRAKIQVLSRQEFYEFFLNLWLKAKR